MHEAPSSQELLSSVIGFLHDVAAPQLSGQAGFHARVAANALALIGRDMALRPEAEARERSLYAQLLQADDRDLPALRQQLCGAIQRGDFDLDDPALLAALRAVTEAQLAIDQPGYSGLTP
ncbi:hypothetical protein PbB2_02006 [Candidatus Phycosocius bacilliformis]|uniref:DUF6285 domain-containing protein n=1 Tax=Candidatus Phycosocius bacilliformis TaxID=1445552 RepID=A0A2P2EB80_9PROT|nr:DUF6285 domain-containing protein [Candidatus Phycosocius bacilliformis]GBF58326.1 hypothetical protein PbB2_02006 [Candidatus Phycosocius bacilliformis]